MKHMCVVVSGCQDLVQFIRDGLDGSDYSIVQVFETTDACQSFMSDPAWADSELWVLVDTYVELPLSVDGGPTRLDAESPSTRLMDFLSLQCSQCIILAITRSGCLNDSQIALQHTPRWFSHSSGYSAWHTLLPKALGDAKEFRDIDRGVTA